MNILVSACLLGEPVRYDGKGKLIGWIKELENDHQLLSMCPEVAGGLPVPRDPAEIRGNSLSILNEYRIAMDSSDATKPNKQGAANQMGEPRSQINNGIASTGVFSNSGLDITGLFLRGAQETLKFCRGYHITLAILKERSPSCGKSQVYDGTHSGHIIPGIGITGALLSQHGIRVFSEEDQAEVLAFLTKPGDTAK